MNKAQKIFERLSLLIERRVKPVHWEDLQKGIKNILNKYPDDNLATIERLKKFTSIYFYKDDGVLQITIPFINNKRASRFDDDIYALANHVGWFSADPPFGNININNPYYQIFLAPGPHPDSDKRIIGLPHYLYHATLKTNVLNIEYKGILPRPDNRHPLYLEIGNYHVIYVALTPEDAKEILWKKGFTDENIAVFKIATNRLDPDVKFYRDPQYAKGIYTNSPIPSRALSLVEN